MERVIEIYHELRNTFYSLEEDIQKFADKKQAAAGKRARKDLLSLQKACKPLRAEIQAIINNNKR